MCGIVGIFHRSGPAPVDRTLLQRMNDSIRHRGPDDGDLFLGAGIGLGHRRLSIIDVAGGHQPIFNEDGTVCVVFNGEIYNFPDLIAELKAAGHRFRTRSDTEVIVHAWEEWGEDCVRRFNGMFAFALWDGTRQTLFLARDRLGEKPLHYAELADGSFLFASELKALLRHPALPRRIDPCAVEEYFAFGYVPDPRTIFRDVRKLEPAHTLTIRRDGAPLCPRRYWDVDFRRTRSIGLDDAAAELTARLREAVRIRLASEVPLGAFLSGGVDSGSVVALMAGLDGSKPVDACSIGFDDPAFDELAYATSVARRHGAAHHVERVDPDDFARIARLVEVHDEPFADSSALPTYRVCALARRHVTVALSGDGGDELFAGYRRYRWHMAEQRIRDGLPLALRRPLFGLLGRAWPKLDWAPRPFRARTTFQALSRDTADAWFHTVSVLPDALRRSLYGPRLRSDLQGHHAGDVLRRVMENAPTEDPLSQVQYADIRTYLPGDILTKVDRASMAHGLEVRVPMLDHTLVEWAATLPPGLRLAGGEGKAVLKRAMEPLLPREVLYRPKMGFSVPIARWFRGPLRRRLDAMLRAGPMADSGLFDPTVVGRLIDQHASGLRDHSAALWSLLMFDGFLRHLEAEAPATAAAAE